jgi:DNA-binding NarL/FixJ family response regulator
VGLGEIVMILKPHRQGVSDSAVARQVGLDHKTVYEYIERVCSRLCMAPHTPRASKIAKPAQEVCRVSAADRTTPAL